MKRVIAFIRARCASQKGSVLIMAMIITSGILVIGIEISSFVSSAIRQARNSDRALVARYAEESALESALHQLRKEQRTTLRSHTGTIGSASWTYEKDPNNSADPVKFSDSIPSFSKTVFPKESVTQFALYKTTNDGTVAIDGVKGVKTLRITWQGIDSACTNGSQPPGIEVSILVWNGGVIDWTTADIEKVFLQDAAMLQTKTAEVDLSALWDDSLKDDANPEGLFSKEPLVVRVKPYFCDLYSVLISLPDPADPLKTTPIPNYFFLKPFGISANVQQDVLQAIVPAQGSISDIFDFALFSEEPITKAQ